MITTMQQVARAVIRSLPAMAAPTAASFAFAGARAAYLSTPRVVAEVAAAILDPEPGMSVYDPASGSGVLLARAARHTSGLRLYGQEISDRTRHLSRLRLASAPARLRLAGGDTLAAPAFRRGDGRLEQFDRIVANPMWDQAVEPSVWAHDPHGRTAHGAPPASSADWGWIQHVLASLAPAGRAVVILSRLTLTRPDETECRIRRAVLESGHLDAVLVASRHPGWPRHHPTLLRWPLHSAAMLVLTADPAASADVLLVDAGSLISASADSKSIVANLTDAWRDRQAHPGLATLVPAAELAAGNAVIDPAAYRSTAPGDPVSCREAPAVPRRSGRQHRGVDGSDRPPRGDQ